MEGGNGSEYLQEDVSYDDFLNSEGWPGSTQHYQYQQPHQAIPSYAHPAYSTQPDIAMDHYDLQQPLYPPIPYTTSHYAPQAQYQHARPSAAFAPQPYNSLAYPVDGSFSFGLDGAENSTISPQSLQYQTPSAQPQNNRGVSNAPFQQPASDFSQRPEDAAYFSNTQNGNMQDPDPQESIRYLSLPSSSNNLATTQNPRSGGPAGSSSAPPPLPQQQVNAGIPQNGLRVTHPQLHAGNNSSSRPRFEYAPFLSWEDTPVQVAPGPKNTLPKYHPRRSKSGRELVPGLDMSGAPTLARVPTKRVRKKTRKERKPSSLSRYKGTSSRPNLLHDNLATLRASDGNAVKSPSTPTETGSSEDETSSEEESEYEEEEIMPLKDISEVRSVTRPTGFADAAGWDATGIIWKDPRSNPHSDVVKGAIEEYGNFVSALRVQLKVNSTEVAKAEEAASSAEVEQLKKARQVLLDALFQTIDAANTLGYPAIVENLGSHHKLVNGLTTTLIECIKSDDFLGRLPKAVFSLLSKFQNMTDELLKKLKFDSITKRWNRKGDDEIKKNITTILANTTEAKEKVAKAKKEAQQAEDSKNLRDNIELSKQRNAEPAKASSFSHAAKRPHDSDIANGKSSKKFAADVAGTPSSSKPIPAKRPTNPLLGQNLLGISAKPAAKPAPKKYEPSPPTQSKLSLLLQQIAEPPKPTKAPEPKPILPPETPEEKKRRERKESRRHLRVKFKEGPALEEVRLFKHEQAEDEGRQDDMLRDAHDERSEGMMHKQRVSENMASATEVEEEDEYDPESLIIEERPYPALIEIDFSGVEKVVRYGSAYTTRGGDMPVNSLEEIVQARREALELMAVYTDPKDIPSTPKEPPRVESGVYPQEREIGGPTAPWLVRRLQELATYPQEYWPHLWQQWRIRHAQEAQSPGAFDRSHSLNAIQPPRAPASSTPSSAAVAAAWDNLTRIITILKGKPYPPIEPPDWMTTPAERAKWWAGLERDKAAQGKREAEKREADARYAQQQAAQAAEAARTLHASQAQASHAGQVDQALQISQALRAMDYQPTPMLPQPTQHPSMHAPPPTIVNPFPPPPSQQPNMLPQVPNMAQQVQNYLASLQVGGSAGNGQPAQQYNFNGYSGGNGYSAGNGYSGSSGQSLNYDDHEQVQRWDGEHDKDNMRSRKKQGQGQSQGSNNPNSFSSKDRGYDMKQWDRGNSNSSGNSGGNSSYIESLFDENGEYKGKKKPCRFYQEGKCAKGAKCTYLHE